MLTPGNKKLGERLIWSFGLPSGRPDLCTGLTDVCQEQCYALRMERLRPDVRAKYEKNLRLSRLPDFTERVRYFILNHEINVVRVHVGGDFYTAGYARKWLRIMRGLPHVRFFFYTRAWRDGSIRPVLEELAELPNCRAWYSCDRATGVPTQLPVRVRLAWLMTTAEDTPPAAVNLIFRIRSLRSQVRTRIERIRVCPEEDGVLRKKPVTCDRCTVCWRPLLTESKCRRSLPILPLVAHDGQPG